MERAKTKIIFSEHAANLCILLVKVISKKNQNLSSSKVNGQEKKKKGKKKEKMKGEKKRKKNKNKNPEELLRTRTALLTQELPR